MKFITGSLVCLNSFASGEFYSSFSSSSFSSSYSNVDGEEHSETNSQEEYAERDSKGLDRRGSGTLVTQDENQVYEKTQNCDGDRCTSTMDTGKRKLKGNRNVKKLQFAI
jgi:hypothetical protein